MSVYDEITQAIVAELEKGVPPWVKSWSSHLPMNVVSQKEYRGINILLLWKASQGKFTSPYWLTYRQAESLGGYVRRGEKATSIVYAATGVKKEGDNETGEEEEREYRFLKYYWVFNIEQTEGISHEKPETKRPSAIIDEAEALITGIGAKVSASSGETVPPSVASETRIICPCSKATPRSETLILSRWVKRSQTILIAVR